MKLLIDSDIIAFKTACVSENKTEDEARDLVNLYIAGFIDYFHTYLSRDSQTHSQHFLTGKGSFRKELDPTYKENRKDKAKPKHLEVIRQHLIDVYEATVSKNGFEADDALGFLQNEDTVIASIDKDLRMIPGYHYHLDDKTLTYIQPFEAMRNFYTQLLTGDAVDNVKGIEGCGPVGAKKLLKDCQNEEQMFQVVYDQYCPPSMSVEHSEARMLKNSKLLWIMQKDKKNPVEERLQGE
jgi:5'-3' exonuclease